MISRYPYQGKNRGYGIEGRTGHGWWHGRCKEGTSAFVGKYRRLAKTLKEAGIEHLILSAILPVMVMVISTQGNQHTSTEGMYEGGSRLYRHVVKRCGTR